MGILKKTITWASLTLFLTMFLLGCSNTIVNDINNTHNSKKEVTLDIMTTTKFLYYMVKDITKEKHIVDYMFNSEKEIWDYKISSDSADNIGKKDLFIYTGAEFEPWMSSFAEELAGNNAGIINVSRGTKIVSNTKEIKYEDRVLKDNPYYWLNSDNYKIMMLNIKNSIEEKDPKNRQFYEDNFSSALKEVEEFHKKYKQLIEESGECMFITSGDKLDYFAKYNNIKTIKLKEEDAAKLVGEPVNSDYGEKFAKAKKIVFLFESDSELIGFDQLIKKYNIKLSNIIAFKEGLSYKEIISKNYDSLHNVLK